MVFFVVFDGVLGTFMRGFFYYFVIIFDAFGGWFYCGFDLYVVC